ncbi:hypothetical protein GCM10022378_11390 [Salinicoccus jeotgali]|uniref:YozE SAM-like domain-containing protein n=1 Tax=Salinicoccus jeotgali TaxID=381634 RepID=A0ABP7ERW8_9STAP
MIQKKAHNRHAPIPTNDQQEPDAVKSYIHRPVEHKPLRLSDYWMDCFHSMFKEWR